MVQATMVYSAKITLIRQITQEVAIAELKIWEVIKSKDYPEGLKYSLFCVLKETGDIIIGFDNHRPKGHHKHQYRRESVYDFKSIDELIDDFWNEVSKRGFIL